MRHRIIILAILSWILAFNQHAWAQTPVAPDIKGIAIDSITAGWNDWTTVSISGNSRWRVCHCRLQSRYSWSATA